MAGDKVQLTVNCSLHVKANIVTLPGLEYYITS